jgi:hypothetical protein
MAGIEELAAVGYANEQRGIARTERRATAAGTIKLDSAATSNLSWGVCLGTRGNTDI